MVFILKTSDILRAFLEQGWLSKPIEPVLPQAAQLGIHFFYFFHNTLLEMPLLEGPYQGHYTGEGK